MACRTARTTAAWIEEVQDRSAGEIVLNCIDQDGARNGYDLTQLAVMRQLCRAPLVASGGAGTAQHFVDIFCQTGVDAALAAGALHRGELAIQTVKLALAAAGLPARMVPEGDSSWS